MVIVNKCTETSKESYNKTASTINLKVSHTPVIASYDHFPSSCNLHKITQVTTSVTTLTESLENLNSLNYIWTLGQTQTGTLNVTYNSKANKITGS